MSTLIHTQKIYLLALKNKKLLSITFLGVTCLYVSIWIDTPKTASDFYHMLVAGIPYQDFSILQMLRFLFFICSIFIFSAYPVIKMKTAIYTFCLFDLIV